MNNRISWFDDSFPRLASIRKSFSRSISRRRARPQNETSPKASKSCQHVLLATTIIQFIVIIGIFIALKLLGDEICKLITDGKTNCINLNTHIMYDINTGR